MYVKSFAAIVASLLVLSWGAFSQCSNQSLTTTFAGGNAEHGNMFDIVCIDPTGVLIQSFEGNWNGTADISIYTHTGSINGTETNPSAWTLIGSATGVVGNGLGVATPIPIAVNQPIVSGNTQAFYVTLTTPGVFLAYTNGTLQGNVFASDASIQFLEGTGNAFPFGAVYTPRIWNGNICYTAGLLPLYETNGPTATLDVDGVIGDEQNLAQVNKSVGPCGTPPATATLNFTGPAGQFYDVLMSPTSIVPGGFSAPPSTEIINLAIWAGVGLSLNGGNPFIPTILPGGFLGSGTATIIVAFATTTAQTVGMQGFCTNVTLPGGYELTQPVELNVTSTPPITSVPGPIFDDQTIAYDITSAPTCWMPNGFNFYGTNYTTIVVDSNGRVEFGWGISDFSPTTAEALSGAPMVGVWADFAPNTGGSITLNRVSPGVVEVLFAGVPYYGNPASSNTFDIILVSNGNSLYLTTLWGLDLTQPTAGDVFLGLSAGSVGTTAGPTTDPLVNTFFDTFLLGGSPALPTDMIYDLGIGALPASINPPQIVRLSEIWFTVDLAGIGYQWNAIGL